MSYEQLDAQNLRIVDTPARNTELNNDLQSFSNASTALPKSLERLRYLENNENFAQVLSFHCLIVSRRLLKLSNSTSQQLAGQKELLKLRKK